MSAPEQSATLSGAAEGQRATTRERSPLEASVAEALRGIVGADGVITDPAALLVYESDGLAAYRSRPRAVILPRTTEEVAASVRVLAAAAIPFVARGAGTGLSGGAVALEDSVLIGFGRMTRI